MSNYVMKLTFKPDLTGNNLLVNLSPLVAITADNP